jgi:DUF3102 family protein
MAKSSKQALVVVPTGFNYQILDARLAEHIQETAERIRERVKKTVEDIIAVGHDLLAAKEALAHGQFTDWLQAEFGWTERTARNFMAVAARFGKTEIISELQIQPTAAYLLAAPSTPEEARQAALQRAEAGEQITTAVAQELVANSRKKSGRASPPKSAENLGLRLGNALERFRDQWPSQDLPALARQLRAFADSLERPRRGAKPTGS